MVTPVIVSAPGRAMGAANVVTCESSSHNNLLAGAFAHLKRATFVLRDDIQIGNEVAAVG